MTQKFGIKCQLQNELCLIVMFHSSLGKSVMIALHLFKLCEGYLPQIGHGTMVFTKRLHFFIFQLPKAEQGHCALANCGGVEFLKFRWRINGCKLRNKKNLIQIPSEFHHGQ
jgi:hypothetical protein